MADKARDQNTALLPVAKAAEILLVEDDPRDAELTLQALRECGLGNRVEHVTDGAEALDYIFAPKSIPSIPKVILLDLNLRKMGGLNVLRQLKTDERTRGIPIVVLTGSKLAVEVVNSYKLGVNSYVLKPTDGRKFVETVAALGHYWLTINETSPA